MKKKCVAMILAGGQGSRLGALTQNVAKPAVSFGAKYKIIDFVISNCANSGIDTVGILTQYQPLDLNTYVGNGQPWDLDVIDGGTPIIPVMLYDEHKAVEMARRMMEKGVYVVAFSYPVVPMGKARIRTQLSAALSKEDVLFIVDCFIVNEAIFGYCVLV